MITAQDCLQNISDYVIGSDVDLKSIYMERINFLYAIPITSLMYSQNGEESLSTFLYEAKEYEKRFLDSSITYLDEFSNLTIENIIGIFSIVSNQLAISRLLDEPRPLLSYLLNECYMGFLDEINDIEKDEGYTLLLSETSFDFKFASCESDDKSLRLLKYNDLVDE